MKMNLLSAFPEQFQFELGSGIDDAVKNFSNEYDALLDVIKDGIVHTIDGINDVLELIPWFILIAIVMALGYYTTKKISNSALFGAMLFFIGMCGLWEQMLQTLSIIIASVCLALILGFPLGILLSLNATIDKILRPLLDLMQTMPSFVYLIPAVMLFGIGKTPALIATTVYAIVPMIRLTSHGIVHVDKEVVEAATAFGSTTMQTLMKVQIPQALPTIMAGVNQTIMMAMSMVVTCAIIGAEGLGMSILIAVNRVEIGAALLPGLAIVFIAITLDRLTQGVGNTQLETLKRPPTNRR